MSGYMQAFAISASGMSVERLRLEVASMNIANAHSTSGPSGQPYHPLRVVSHAVALTPYANVENRLASSTQVNELKGVGAVEIRETTGAPRLEQDPGNPNADAHGFVSLPPVNPVEEMVTILTSVRAYEANVRAMNAAKTMALKALEIGGGRS